MISTGSSSYSIQYLGREVYTYRSSISYQLGSLRNELGCDELAGIVQHVHDARDALRRQQRLHGIQDGVDVDLAETRQKRLQFRHHRRQVDLRQRVEKWLGLVDQTDQVDLAQRGQERASL